MGGDPGVPGQSLGGERQRPAPGAGAGQRPRWGAGRRGRAGEAGEPAGPPGKRRGIRPPNSPRAVEMAGVLGGRRPGGQRGFPSGTRSAQRCRGARVRCGARPAPRGGSTGTPASEALAPRGPRARPATYMEPAAPLGAARRRPSGPFPPPERHGPGPRLGRRRAEPPPNPSLGGAQGAGRSASHLPGDHLRLGRGSGPARSGSGLFIHPFTLPPQAALRLAPPSMTSQPVAPLAPPHPFPV